LLWKAEKSADIINHQCHMILQKSKMLNWCSRIIWKQLCCFIFLWKLSYFFIFRIPNYSFKNNSQWPQSF